MMAGHEAKAREILDPHLTDTPDGYVIDFYEAVSAIALALQEAQQAQRWRPIDDEAKNGKQYLFLCRYPDEFSYIEQHIVLEWREQDCGWVDWDGSLIANDFPVAYMPLPSPPAPEAA